MKSVFATLAFSLLTIQFAKAQPLSQEQAEALTNRLGNVQATLQKSEISGKHRADIDVCLKAVGWALRHQEFKKKEYHKYAMKCLALAGERIEAANSGKVTWDRQPGKTVLGYRSKVDRSVQPYAVTLPAKYDSKAAKRWPLYVVLHGRGGQNEIRFIANHNGKPAPESQDWIQIDIFGRIDNAYRWAGETDVFEAMEDVIRRYKIDEQRVSLWGFSMGGAGAWHLGLQHPSRWASVGAGAGFVDFYEYQKHPYYLPDYQHRALTIYDTKNYALNLRNVPFVTYGGELDKQLRTSYIMQEQAQPLNVPLKLIVGPKMGHKFDEASKAEFMAFLKTNNDKGRKRVPGIKEIEFVTHTLKYNRCEWLTIEEMEVPYKRTTVKSFINGDGELELKTENVSALSVVRGPADFIRIDDSRAYNLNTSGGGNLTEVYFVKEAGGWVYLSYDDSIAFLNNPDLNKRNDLQGPIDDAFMEPFVCVSGTGEAWSSALDGYAKWSLTRFESEFDKWMRAKPIVVADTELTDKEIRNKNLVLFGDPGSNSVIARVVKELPITWTQGTITINGKEYSTKDHAVVLIYPNPLNPNRYVVINSGMTTHEKDFKASNSWLFPKLGDHAVIRFQKNDKGYKEETVNAGIFNSAWKFE